MRKIVKSPIVVGLVVMLSMLPNLRKGELKDVAKPHLGFYQCTEAKLQGQDLLSRFDKIDLELKSDGTFVLRYCEKGGRLRTETGQYEYHREKGTVVLQGKNIRREFPLKKGVLTVTLSLAGETLHLKFEQK